MGANTFYSVARRGAYSCGEMHEEIRGGVKYLTPVVTDWPDAQTAFNRLVSDSQYESGHMYSGEIGMKHSFVHISTVDTPEEAIALAGKLIEDCDPRIDDKWGPAGCITIREGSYQYLFFGWASS